MSKFGSHIRRMREDLAKNDQSFSQRQLSKRIGIESSYLSKIERGLPATLSERKIILLAQELGADPDHLLALGGKISSDVQEIIKGRPELFSKLIRELKNLPDGAIEVETEFRGVMDALNVLHDLASIGAFRLAAEVENSYYSEQVESILELKKGVSPTFETLLSPFSAEERQRLREADIEAVKTGAPQRMELSFVSKNGQTKYILLWGYAYADSVTGGIVRSGIIQDVTESTELRNEINAAKQSLELEVDKQSKTTIEAIEDLKNEIAQRKRLQEDLAELNRDVLKKAAVQNQTFKEIAFQIKTLTSSIILKKSFGVESDPGMNEMLSQLVFKVDSLGDLIASEQSELESVEFDIGADIRSLLDGIHERSSADQPCVNYSQAPSLPKLVRGDESRIKRILNAVLELVIQVTAWGDCQFSSRVEDGDRPSLIFTFYTPALAGQITKGDFYPTESESKVLRLNNPVRLVGPVVEDLGGEVDVRMPSPSELSIQLSIPMEVVSTDDHAPSSEAKSLGERSVLVVEDDPFNLLFMEKGLEGENFIVDTAEDGRTAIECVQSKSYDLILLDIQLPDISGTEVAKSISQTDGHGHGKTPIIAVTAHVSVEDRKLFQSLGIAEVVSKPFELSYLVSRINSVLNQ